MTTNRRLHMDLMDTCRYCKAEPGQPCTDLRANYRSGKFAPVPVKNIHVGRRQLPRNPKNIQRWNQMGVCPVCHVGQTIPCKNLAWGGDRRFAHIGRRRDPELSYSLDDNPYTRMVYAVMLEKGLNIQTMGDLMGYKSARHSVRARLAGWSGQHMTAQIARSWLYAMGYDFTDLEVKPKKRLKRTLVKKP